MKKNKDIDDTHLLIKILFLAIVILIALFTYRAYSHFNQFESHRHYLRDNNEIQPWMTVDQIGNYLNITDKEVYKKINVTWTLTDEKLPLTSICRKNHLDCNEVIRSLEK